MSVLLSILSTTLSSATPLIFAALGGLFSERSGVVNVALEGIMLISAFTSVAFAYYTGNAWMALILTMLIGGLVGLVHAVVSIKFKAEHVVSGTGINFLAVGLTGLLMQSIFGLAGASPRVDKLPTLGFPGFLNIPVLSGHNVLVYLAIVMVLGAHYFLNKTPWGLRLRAVGEHPRAADTVGINVIKYRYFGVIASGVIASIGGTYLALGPLGFFFEGMTVGKGFIALAALIFGKWTAFGALLACLLFGFFDALQIQLQVWGFSVPSQIIRSIPYLLTIFAVVGAVGRSTPPAAVGTHYEK